MSFKDELVRRARDYTQRHDLVLGEELCFGSTLLYSSRKVSWKRDPARRNRPLPRTRWHSARGGRARRARAPLALFPQTAQGRFGFRREGRLRGPVGQGLQQRLGVRRADVFQRLHGAHVTQAVGGSERQAQLIQQLL